jgi:hypothetical protein
MCTDLSLHSDFDFCIKHRNKTIALKIVFILHSDLVFCVKHKNKTIALKKIFIYFWEKMLIWYWKILNKIWYVEQGLKQILAK